MKRRSFLAAIAGAAAGLLVRSPRAAAAAPPASPTLCTGARISGLIGWVDAVSSDGVRRSVPAFLNPDGTISIDPPVAGSFRVYADL